MPGEGRSGLALRTYDLARGLWSIYWVSSADGRLQPPWSASFDDGVGRFEGEDMDGDRPIRARFLWRPLDARHGALGAGFLDRRRRDLGNQLDDGLRADRRLSAHSQAAKASSTSS